MNLPNSPIDILLAPCGRRSLKTEIPKRIMAQALDVPKPWKDPHYIIAAPTVGQVKNIVWNDIKALIPPWKIKRIYESKDDLRIVTIWGSDLRLIGLDKPARMEGAPIDGIWVTEWANCKAGIWDAHMSLALADRNGWAILEGVPDFEQENNIEYEAIYNRAVKYFDDDYDLDDRAAALIGVDTKDAVSEEEGNGPDQFEINPRIAACVWSSEKVLPPHIIEKARNDLDPLYYLQEIGGKFVRTPNLAYYSFAEALNVGKKRAAYVKGLPVYLGCDFNFGHHNWICAQLVRNELTGIMELRVFDQVYLQNADVQLMCEQWKSMMQSSEYEIAEHNMIFTGDIQGGKRRVAESTSSAWEIIESAFPKANFEYFRTNPPISDSLREVNNYIVNTKGVRRLSVHPRAKELRLDLRYVTRTELLKQDKTGARTHASDCLRYLIWYLEKVR